MTAKSIFYGCLSILLLVGCAGMHLQDEPSGTPDQPDGSTLPDSLLAPGADFDVAPEFVSMDAPVYPDDAKDAGVEGTVLVRILCGDDGLVKSAYVVRGIPMLNHSALTAARSARFKPATRDRQPIEVWMVIPINYSLRG